MDEADRPAAVAVRLAVVLAALAAPAAAQAAPAWRGPIEAYASWPSVRAGESLELHVSSRDALFDLELRRQGEEQPRVTRRGQAGGERAAPAGAPGEDCGWPVTCTLPIGADWPSGTWWARLSLPGADAACEVPFTVRPAAPSARVLVLQPWCTVAAHETWGGASLYPSAWGPPVPVVTLRRPHDATTAHGLLRHGDPAFETWLAEKGLVADHAADVDLQREPDLLQSYDLVLLVGHHESWSAGMRARFDAFVGNGGRVAVLGADTCCGQVRFEQEDTALRVAGTFLGEPVLDAQERTLGMSWQHAAWSAPLQAGLEQPPWILGAAPAAFSSAEGFGCWRVAAPDQPDLAGLDLLRGALLGAAPPGGRDDRLPVGLCGGEVDGVLVEEIHGARPASAALGAPRNVLVLADAPAQEGFACITSFERGGEVLWCSSERWLRGFSDPRLAAPDLSHLVESALRRLARPRRNLLRNASFEDWEGESPRGWEVSGTVRRAGADEAATGREALELPSGSMASVRQTVRNLGGGNGHLLLGVARTAATAPVLTLHGPRGLLGATRRASADGRVHAAWVPAAGADGDATLQVAALGGERLLLDQLELIDERALREESLALAPAADGVRLLAAPTPGGGQVLVVVREPRAAEVMLLDADDGRRLGHVARASGTTDPLLLAAGDGSRGRMAHLALAIRDAEGRALLPGDTWLLPLRFAAPAPLPRLRDGGFEHADADGRPLDWLPDEEASARLLPEARLTGGTGLRLHGGSKGAGLGQRLTAPAADDALVLSGFVRGAGEVTLTIQQGSRRLAQATLTVDAEWRGVRLVDAVPQSPDDLLVWLRAEPGAQIDVDALALRTARELLVDDLYPNGAFEIAPSEDECERGADWTARLPRWSALAGPPPSLDATHALGRHSLRLAPGATALTHLGWPVAADRPALVGARVWAEDGPATLRLLVGREGSPAPPEVARWTGGSVGEWEDALLAVTSADTEGAPPDAWLVVEAGPGGAWLDDLTFLAEE